MQTEKQLANLLLSDYKLTAEDTAKSHSPEANAKRAATRKKNKLLKEEILKEMKAKDWQEIVRGLIDRAKEDTNSYTVLEKSIGQAPASKVELETENTIEINITGDNKEK